jgi:LysR family glycine cleavage system transcriptional activator
MMGRLDRDQKQLFYAFDLDDAVPGDHPVRQIAGVTLAQASLVDADLRAGRLTRPFATAIDSRYSYYLVCPPAALRRSEIATFRDWLGSEMSR